MAHLEILLLLASLLLVYSLDRVLEPVKVHSVDFLMMPSFQFPCPLWQSSQRNLLKYPIANRKVAIGSLASFN